MLDEGAVAGFLGLWFAALGKAGEALVSAAAAVEYSEMASGVAVPSCIPLADDLVTLSEGTSALDQSFLAMSLQLTLFSGS